MTTQPKLTTTSMLLQDSSSLPLPDPSSLQPLPDSSSSLPRPSGESAHRPSAADPGSTPRRSGESSHRPSPRMRSLPLASDDGEREKIPKRIIVCCDGTWENGVMKTMPSKYSNILKLSRMMNPQDNRTNPSTPQIVFYQPGVGTEPGVIMEWISGATGAFLGEKVQEAYAFIAHNFQPKDEIYLFGFSRGAYTVRMVAAFIGEIGILDKNDMDHFADIFLNYEKRAHTKDPAEYAQLTEKLAPFISPTSKGRLRAGEYGNTFTVKVLGVFDTVGSLGLPSEVRLTPQVETLFGFPDTYLGEHIENAFHAMAIDEVRRDFEVQKFHQTDLGRARKQVLKQVWFSGAHTDIGGGYQAHDLSDITLAWMAANIESMLSIDIAYMKSLPNPVGQWGTQAPHNSATGIFQLAAQTPRSLPPLSLSSPTFPTFESIHPSVLSQLDKVSHIKELLAKNPGIVCKLMPLEEEIRKLWTEDVLADVEKTKRRLTEASVADSGGTRRTDDSLNKPAGRRKSVIRVVKDMFGFGVKRNVTLKGKGKRESEKNGSWLGAVSKEMKT